jgi:predicted nucleic acid-binding protein
MTLTPVVSNASPLIALEQLDHLRLLEHLFGSVLIPLAVVHEVAPTVTLPAWIEAKELTQPVGPRILSASLGPGESEAIALALETEAKLVILDERPARRLAQALHLPVIGTLGILLAAKRRQLLVSIRPYLDTLLQYEFRIAPNLYDEVLSAAGEDPGSDAPHRAEG